MTAPEFREEPIRLTVPTTQEGYETYLYLDRECRECEGDGRLQSVPLSAPCPDCSGMGRIPSEAGLAVLRLILRYGNQFGIEIRP